MSEHFSANLRSGALKRRRLENLDSGGSTGRSGCQYRGCSSPWSRENDTSRRFCCNTCQNSVMAERYDLIKNGGAHVTEESSGICKLPGCGSATGDAYNFCRHTHFVEYEEQISENWGLEDRLCKFEKCCMHVHVDETSKEIWEYCSREHESEAARERGKLRAAAKRKAELTAATGVTFIAQDMTIDPARADGGKDSTSSGEMLQRSTSQEAPQFPLPRKVKQAQGYHKTIDGDYILHCLKHLIHNPGDYAKADPRKLFCVKESIEGFHPFDDVIEFGGSRPKWYLHFIESVHLIDPTLPKRDRKLRSRSTKQFCKWKQSGPSHENKATGFWTTYLHYEASQTGDEHDHCDGWLAAYRQYQKDCDTSGDTGKLTKVKGQKSARHAWRRAEVSLSKDVVNDLITGPLPIMVPVISKIKHNKSGLPVGPPVQQGKETQATKVSAKEKHPLLGSTTEATIFEGGTTSSIASNASAAGEGLPSGGRTFQGKFSNNCKESDDFLPLQDTAMAVIANESTPPVPVTFDVGECGMVGDIFSNTSTQVENLVGQNANSNELEEFDLPEFLRNMGEIADEINVPVTCGNAFLGEGFACMNPNASLLDMFDQTQVGCDNMLNGYMDHGDGLQWMQGGESLTY